MNWEKLTQKEAEKLDAKYAKQQHKNAIRSQMGLQWENIKEKYPKAFEEFLSNNQVELTEFNTIGNYLDGESMRVFFGFKPCDLYSYFDGLGIVVNAGTDTTIKNKLRFFPALILKLPRSQRYGTIQIGESFKTRIEAETTVFTKAFEIRENLLKSES